MEPEYVGSGELTIRTVLSTGMWIGRQRPVYPIAPPTPWVFLRKPTPPPILSPTRSSSLSQGAIAQRSSHSNEAYPPGRGSR